LKNDRIAHIRVSEEIDHENKLNIATVKQLKLKVKNLTNENTNLKRRLDISKETQKNINKELDDKDIEIEELKQELYALKEKLSDIILTESILKIANEQNEGEQKTSEHVDECCICMNKLTERYVLIPCGHTQTCDKCIDKVTKCPLCKKVFKKVLKVFV
jgi:chromosome segregation ATPase